MPNGNPFAYQVLNRFLPCSCETQGHDQSITKSFRRDKYDNESEDVRTDVHPNFGAHE